MTHLQALTGLGKGRFAALGREGNAAIQLVVFRVVGEELQLEGMTRVKPGTVALACGGLVEDSQESTSKKHGEKYLPTYDTRLEKATSPSTHLTGWKCSPFIRTCPRIFSKP